MLESTTAVQAATILEFKPGVTYDLKYQLNGPEFLAGLVTNQVASDLRSKGMELVDLRPTYDEDGRRFVHLICRVDPNFVKVQEAGIGTGVLALGALALVGAITIFGVRPIYVSRSEIAKSEAVTAAAIGPVAPTVKAVTWAGGLALLAWWVIVGRNRGL